MKKIQKSKYFIGGIIVGLTIITAGVGATVTGGGNLGSLFMKTQTTSSEIDGNDGINTYKLKGAHIQDGSITGGEIQDNSLKHNDLAPNSVRESELANNSVVGGAGGDIKDDSITAADLAPNSVGNSELKNTSTFNIAKLGIGIASPLADLHIKGNGLIKLEGGGSSNYWSLNAYDDGTDFSISRNNGYDASFIFRQNGDLDIKGDLIIGGTINGDKIEDNTIDSSEIEDDTIASIDIKDDTIASIDIENNTITEDDIIDSFKARDSDKLDGLNSTAFQKKITGSCSANSSIRIIADNGTVTCEDDTDTHRTINSVNYVTKSNGSNLVNSSIYDNGKVGIGTSNPTAKLDVRGNIKGANLNLLGIKGDNNYRGELKIKGDSKIILEQPAGYFLPGDVSSHYTINVGPYNRNVGGRADFSIDDLNGGSFQSRLLINKQGYVGIGTIDPTSKLHVKGNIKGANLNLLGVKGDNNYRGELKIKGDSKIILEQPAGYFLPGDVSSHYTINVGPYNRNVGGRADFSIDDLNGGSFQSRLLINKQGYVGIGTIDPTSKLHVKGPMYIESNLDVQGNSSKNGALVIGNKSGNHISIDNNEIMAKNGNSTEQLNFNLQGGKSYFGGKIYSKEFIDGKGGFKVDGTQMIGADKWIEGDRIRQNSIDGGEIQNNSITESDISDSFKARNSDKLDGHDTPYFQKRVSGSCGTGYSVYSINSNGTVNCRKGPKGDKGLTGARGPRGYTGARGPRGYTGESGAGAKLYFDTNTLSLRGDSGEYTKYCDSGYKPMSCGIKDENTGTRLGDSVTCRIYSSFNKCVFTKDVNGHNDYFWGYCHCIKLQ